MPYQRVRTLLRVPGFYPVILLTSNGDDTYGPMANSALISNLVSIGAFRKKNRGTKKKSKTTEA